MQDRRTIESMTILRLFGKIVGILFLHIGLWILLLFFVFSQFLATPDYLLQSAKNNNVYSATTEEIIDTTIQEKGTELNGIAIEKERYEEALQAVITPQFIQSQAEIVVEATYDWLEGTTDKPSFTLNIDNQREELINELSMLAVEELEALPTCNSFEQLQINANLDNPTCIPPNFNPQQTRETFAQELRSSPDFFGETQVNSEELFDSTSDSQTQINWQEGPRQFERAQTTWLYGTILILLGAGIGVLSSKSRLKGIRFIALQVLLVGVAIGLLAVAGAIVGGHTFGLEATNALEVAGIDMLGEFTSDLTRLLFVFAGLYTGVGIAGLIAIKKKKPTNP